MKSVSTTLTILVPLLIYPYVCRIIHVDGIGKVNFAQSIIYYFTMIAQLGVPTYGIREVAKDRNDRNKLSKTVQEIFIINMITCAISYALFFLCLMLVPEMKNDKVLFLVMSLSTVLQIIGVEWLYSGLEMYDRMAILSIIFKIIMVLGTYLLVKKESDYIWYGLMLITGSCGMGIINFLTLGKVINIKPCKKISLGKHIKPIAVFFAMSVAVTIYTQMDSVMIGFLNGTTENGYYATAVKIKTVLVSFITVLGSVIMPRATSYLENKDKHIFFELGNKALAFVFAVSIPVCMFCILFAAPSIHVLSGEGFENSIMPMKLIMPTLILIGVSNITGIQVMVPLGREKGVLYAEIVGAIVNLIINVILIPKLGSSGAAIGTVAAELVVLIVELYYIRDILDCLFSNIDYIIIVIGTVLASIGSAWLISSKLPEILVLIFAGIIFFAVYCSVVLPRMIRKYRN